MNLLQQLVNGLVLGHIYALIAIGWTLLLGVAKLVNFGHGQMYMLGAFVTWWLSKTLGLNYPIAMLGAAILIGILGIGMQRVMLKATFGKNLVAIMIMTLGFGYIMEGVGTLTFGGTGQIVATEWEQRQIRLGTLWLTWQDAAIVIVTISLFIVLHLILGKARIGRQIRMVAEDPKLAQLAALNVRRIYYAVFAFEGAAVALAAGLVAPRAPILTSMGFEETVITFVVVILGGIGSVAGSYIAGITLGLFTAFFSALVSPAYATAAAFLLLIIVLIVRPSGIGGATKGVH